MYFLLGMFNFTMLQIQKNYFWYSFKKAYFSDQSDNLKQARKQRKECRMLS
jgi:hypothetical protein